MKKGSKISDLLHNKWMYIIILLFLVSISTVYYYGLQRLFTPNSESLNTLWIAYWSNLNNASYSIRFYSINIAKIVVNLWGYSLKSMRIYDTIPYFLISIFAYDIVLRDENNEIHYRKIPLYMLFMVFMHMGSSEVYGRVNAEIHQYPFNFHVYSVFFAVFGIWILKWCERSPSKFRWIVFILCCVLSLFLVDSIYLITFTCPILIVFGTKLIKSDKQFVNVIISGVVLVFLLKLLSGIVPGISKLFVGSSELYSTEVIRGVTNFRNIFFIPGNIMNYLGALTGLFNTELSNKSVQNIGLIVVFVRILLVLAIFILVVKQLPKVKRDAQDNKYCDSVISLGFLLLSFFFIFTDNGECTHYVRYLTTLIPYGTIILCSNFERIAEAIHCQSLAEPKRMFTFFSLCCLISFNWTDWFWQPQPNEYERDYQDILQIVEEQNLGKGITSMAACNILTAMSEVKHIVSQGFYSADTEKLYPQGSSIDGKNIYEYVLIGDIKDWNDMFGSVQEIIDAYGEPDELIELNHYTMMIYRDGIALPE